MWHGDDVGLIIRGCATGYTVGRATGRTKGCAMAAVLVRVPVGRKLEQHSQSLLWLL